MKTKFTKNIANSLSLIKTFKTDTEVTLLKKYRPKYSKTGDLIKLDKDGYRFISKFKDFDNPIELGSKNGMRLKTVQYEIEIERFYVGSTGFGYEFEAEINTFHTKGFTKNKKYYFRLFIPISKGRKTDFHFQIDNTKYTTGNFVSGQCIRIKISDYEIDFYVYDQNKDDKHLILECVNQKLTIDQFEKLVFSVSVSFGFITGKYIMNEGYFVAYSYENMDKPKHLKYATFRDSMFMIHSPIYSNPYGYIHKRNVAKRYYDNKVLRNVTLDEFSILCQLTQDNIDFSSVLLLIMESSISSLLFRPTGYYVALETLANIFSNNDSSKLKQPLKIGLARKVRRSFNEVVQKHITDKESDEFRYLNGLIEHLNSPRRPSNNARLEKMFTELGIELNELDKEAILYRNVVLHGNTFKDKDVKESNNILLEKSYRMYILLCRFILKKIGYSNKVVNYSKLMEIELYGKSIEEDYYRQV